MLTHEVRKNIVRIGQHTGFLLSYTNYFLGQRLKAECPLRKWRFSSRWSWVRTCRKSLVEMWYGSSWTSNHKRNSGRHTDRIDHRDFLGVDAYMAKHNEYAIWEASIFHYNKLQRTRSSWKPHQRLIPSHLIALGRPSVFLRQLLWNGRVARWINWFCLFPSESLYFTQIAYRLSELELEHKIKNQWKFFYIAWRLSRICWNRKIQRRTRTMAIWSRPWGSCNYRSALFSWLKYDLNFQTTTVGRNTKIYQYKDAL